MSSPRMQDSDSKNIAFEVNPMMVLFSHEVGGSYAVLETFSAVMGIPAMHLKTYQRHDKKVTAAEMEAGSAMLQRSAAAVQKAYAETDEDLREALDRGENPIINISVSYDGTWQKRGLLRSWGGRGH
ncbi:hypothetical protein V1264_022198 [Littorina saxatilis]|uniref:Mutator-like transposase domain-containing protein n=1 Tax=Littorina saxatilis TaxID=31220 RepID=A0AAN9FXG6_9CAEN